MGTRRNGLGGVQEVIYDTANVPAQVAATTSVVTVLAANPLGRYAAAIFNEADQPLYIKFGAGASATSWTMKIGAGGYYELPGSNGPGQTYSGVITGFWTGTPTGKAAITELS